MPRHLAPEAGHGLAQRVQLVGGAQGLEARLGQLGILPEQLGLEPLNIALITLVQPGTGEK